MLLLAIIIVGGITTAGDSVATAVAELDTVASPQLGPYAYSLSVGPLGPWREDSTQAGELTIVRPFASVLRVVQHQCELSEWLTIDDITVADADSRRVQTQYVLSIFPGFGFDKLWIRPKRPGMLRPLTDPPSVHWQDADAFFIPYHEDTLFVRHLSSNRFQITARARMEYITSQEYDRIIDSLRVQQEQHE